MSTTSNESSTVTYYPNFQALAAAMAPDAPRPRLRPATDFPAEDVAWLWPGKIPIGKVTLLVGDPGCGKSLVAIDAASRVSRGVSFPDGPRQGDKETGRQGVSPAEPSSHSLSPCLPVSVSDSPSMSPCLPISLSSPPTTNDSTPTRQTPGSVLILSAEDQIADTIRPRLDAAGADPSKVFFASDITDLRLDLGKLALALEDAPDCRLIIVDPVTAYVGPSDSHFHTIVRKVLAPLAELAAKRKIAILAVTHLRKNSGAAITRATGSMGFAAAARCIWTICRDESTQQRDNTRNRDQQHAGRSLLLPVKNTFGPKDAGLAFSIERPAGSPAAIIAWQDSPVTISAEEVLTPIHKPRGPAAEERRHAGEWLERFLKQGPREAWRILDEGKHRGFGERTLRRALRELGGDTRKDAYLGGWIWTLEPPQELSEEPNDATKTGKAEEKNSAVVKKPVPLGETCPLPENTHASDAVSTADHAPHESPFPFEPPPPPVAESIHFLNNLDKHRKPPDQVDEEDPNSPTGHPLLDQLLSNFRKPLTTDDQQLTAQKKSARSHSRLPTGTDSWHFTRPADPCESGAMHLGDVSAQALDESNTRRRKDADYSLRTLGFPA